MPTPITVSVNFIDLAGNTPSGYMQAAVVSPSGVADLYVANTGIIAPKLTISGTGTTVSVVIWGNDVIIDSADGLKDTYYIVTLFNTLNVPVWSASYIFTGSGPINLVGYPPLTSVPAPTGPIPTNILTGNNVFTGTNVFSGPVTFTSGTFNAAGVDKQIQFNDGGSFGGNANFTFSKATGLFTLTGSEVVNAGSNSTPGINVSAFSTAYTAPALNVTAGSIVPLGGLIQLSTAQTTAGPLLTLTTNDATNSVPMIQWLNRNAPGAANFMQVLSGGNLYFRNTSGGTFDELSFGLGALGYVGSSNSLFQLTDRSTGLGFTVNVTPGKITQYASVSTAGLGVPAVYGATSQKTESAADINVLTFTPPAAAGTYRLSFVMSLSAANAATLGWTATWKDSNANAQTPTNLALFQSGAAAPALTFTTSTPGNYHGTALVDVDSSATNIVVKLTFSGTSFTGKVSSTVERIQ